MAPVLHDTFPLRKGRTHEVFGPGATGFAAICAAGLQGPVIWVRESWQSDTLAPVGLSAFFDPARLLVAQAQNQIELLAVAEEALRDGAVPLVVMELSQPVELTPGRRLQLAAKAGQATGLCIIPEGMGSNAAETRWRAAPVYDETGADSTLMRWELRKNKSGTLGAWDVRWTHSAHRLDVVPPVGERPGSAAAPD
jgi:protein ImuA